jgi:hypothetical protein
MQRLLSRFAFSFVIICAVLIWEAYRMLNGSLPVETWKLVLYCVGAGACGALAVAGIRARHRDLD